MNRILNEIKPHLGKWDVELESFVGFILSLLEHQAILKYVKQKLITKKIHSGLIAGVSVCLHLMQMKMNSSTHFTLYITDMTQYQCEKILNAFPGFFGENMAVGYLLHIAQACSWEAKPEDVDRYR